MSTELVRAFFERLEEVTLGSEGARIATLLYDVTFEYRDEWFRSHAILVEAAAEASYVDLSLWEHRTAFASQLERAVSRSEFGKVEADACARLLGRLSGQYPSKSSEERVAAFEAFLQLEVEVRDDYDARLFLHASALNGSCNLDLPALLSPRHFAEALLNQAIDSVPVTDVGVALRLLEYFRRLSEIRSTVGRGSYLDSVLLLHAEWAGWAGAFQYRLEFWSNEMEGWRDDVSNESASRIRNELSDLARVHPRKWNGIEDAKAVADSETRRRMWRLTGVFPLESGEDLRRERLEQLLVEGKYLEAANLMISAHYPRAMDLLADPDLGGQWSDDLTTMVTQCVLLASMGRIDAAAALVAPFAPAIANPDASGDFRTILDIMNASRNRTPWPPSGQPNRSSSASSGLRPLDDDDFTA